jgi:hypothetical protein
MAGMYSLQTFWERQSMPKKFTYWRNSIVAEFYEVVAENEEEAYQQLMDGYHDPVNTEWVDWATGTYEIEDVEELDPLYRMVKDYKLVDKLDV